MRTFRQGKYIIRDDLSGKIVFNDEIEKRWDGLLVEKKRIGTEGRRQPQEFVRAKADPYPTSPIRTRHATLDVDFVDANIVQGVTLPLGAAQHLFPSKVAASGIGVMRIMKDGTTRVSAMSCAVAFIVR